MHYWLRELKHFYYEMEDRWQRLGVKEWIEWHPRAVIGITIACFLVFVMIAIAQLTPDTPNPPEESKQTWFYDLNTKKLFIAKSSKLPPIKTASGELPDGTPAGVRAYVFMPTDQQQPTEPFIGFLETLSPEGRKIQKSYDPKNHNAKQWAKGRLFRRPDDQQWFPADSPEGMEIYTNCFNKNKLVDPDSQAGKSFLE
ncbi:MAG: hypothetical protein ACYSOK_04230 [Planctomycetota bacterium]|jgi:hypothetical protein